MAINAKNDGKKFTREIQPSGVHRAVCYSMVHIGTIKDTNSKGEEVEINKVRITWELSDELRIFKPENGEQPMVISKEFTLSMHEKANLRKMLEQWRGKGFTEEEAKCFDITALLGVSCQLNIIHKTSKKGDSYAEISGVMPLGKGSENPKQINPSFVFDYEPFDQSKFDSLPNFIQEKIMASKEFKALSEPVAETEPKGDLF